MSPYELIADIAERELELVHTGAFERLPELHRERAAVVATLPPRPPAGARAALEAAAATQAQVTAALDARMRDVSVELARLGRGKSAVSGYKPQLPARPRVDRCG